jgi:hypothetical protein
MVRALLASRLLPLCAGLLFLEWLPSLSEKLKQTCGRLSLVLNLSVFGLIVGDHFDKFGASAYVQSRARLRWRLAAAHWLALGQPGSSNRNTMGFSTAVRNVAVSLVIATDSFSWHTGCDCSFGIRSVSDPRLGHSGLCVGPFSSNQRTNYKC